MACTNCTPTYPVASYVFSGTAPCTNCDQSECPQGIHPTSCIYNDGPALLCIGAAENERLDSILNKIDALLCEVSGVNPYPGYNTYCLGTMENQQEFVETISQQFCTLQSAYNTFTGTTFPAAIASINSSIDDLNSLNISSCVAIGYTPGDTIAVAITKLSNYACSISSSLDVSTVDWDQCTVVTTPPTNIVEAFDFVVDQLCNIAASTGAALPTFNNIGTCLDSPGATDSLVSTITKIRSKVCTAPSYNPGTYTGGCFSVSGATSLDTLLQSLLTEVSSVMQALPRVFDGTYFTVSDITPGDPCDGKQVTLTGAVSSDRFVAINPGDISPATLVDKVAPGTGISLDFGTINPGKMTITSSVTGGDEKVKVNALDPTAGYLEDKLDGSTSTISISTNTVSNQVQISASVDYDALITSIFDLIEEDEDLKTRFCSIVNSCPSPCAAPSNVQVVF